MSFDAENRPILREFMANNPLIVAIDGPAGAGKSSVSSDLAQSLGILYLDTGSMYRMVAWLRSSHAIGADDQATLIERLESSRIDIRQGMNGTAVFVEGNDITDFLRKPEISAEASRVSAWSAVRRFLVPLQRRLCEGKQVVVEGRDIGTVVFPGTPFKFFLTASLDERTHRRQKQHRQQGIERDFAMLRREIEERDYHDSHREDSPLTVADDAIYIDTTDIHRPAVVERIIASIERIITRRSSGRG